MAKLYRIPIRARDRTIRAHVLVDEEDYRWAVNFKWHWGGKDPGYPARMIADPDSPYKRKRRRVYLHKEILVRMGHTNFEVGDHKNGNSFDCRRENLLPTTQIDNNKRKHKYAGKRLKRKREVA